MMWWKMAGWLGKAVASALIVSFLAIWTTGYIVNSYVEALIKDYNLPMKTQPFALSGVWGKLWGADEAEDGRMTAEAGQEDGSSRDANPSKSSGDGSGYSEHGSSAGRDAEGDARDGGQENQTDTSGGDDPAANPFQDEGMNSEASTDGTDGQADPDSGQTDQLTDAGSGDNSGLDGDEAKAETGSGTGSQAQSAQGEAVITPEELARAKDQMSEEDRNKLFAMLVSKLPQSEWQTISTYVESGLTDEEMTNIQQIVAKHLDREEYEELMDILKKY
ncbi:hypothetical protein [Paenibacillus tarimensis]|uniref:hypothetical protein n=1 Tax=Paenibacillus tarimensis TaxID=416012 RepID=UPI001F1AC739|nr:hypothetical protein [Paenibacillus tarimensis]MCF2944510.1 hypothetical protein [Paenibacillus tarimensis]